MKKIFFSLFIAIALFCGAVQSSAKAETLNTKSVFCKVDYTDVVEIDGKKYLITYSDRGEIIHIEPTE